MHRPATAASPADPERHFLQFYASDDLLVERVADFLQAGLDAGEPAIVIATERHRSAFIDELAARGIDVARAQSAGELAILDAHETLARFMVNGAPDRERFLASVGGAVAALTAQRRQARAYGEMVDVLWSDGNPSAALELEGLWNELQREHGFALLCAYAMAGFYREPENMVRVCAAHSHVVAEGDGAIAALAAEIAARKDVERALRATVDDLRANERALSASHARAEILARLARAALDAESAREVFDAALDAMESALHTSRGAVLVADREGVMRFRAWRALSDEYRAAVEGHSPWAADARDPQPVLVPDVSEPAWSAYRALFERERIGALAFIPLVSRGRIHGKLMAYFDRPRELTPAEVELAQAVADHAASAVARFEALDELRDALHMHETFVAVLGHDLRNPLAAITAAADVARLDAPPRIDTALGRIVASSVRMSRMIDQLLDFTRVRLGQGLPLSRSRTDVLAIIREAIDELEHQGRAVNVEHLGPTHGSFDPDRMAQLFSNLIANAIQHGLPDAPVTVRAGGSDTELSVEVHNKGAIDEARQRTIFEPLLGQTGRRDGSHGLGLGLHIAQEIARAHGGAIEVRSSPEEGTTFHVALPRGAADEASIVPRARSTEREGDDTELRLLVDSVRDYAIFLLDPEGRVRTWNAGARLLKGYETAEILGRSVEVFHTPQDRALGRPQRLLRAAMREGRVEDEGWRVRKDGTRFWADVVITALRGEDGRLRGFAKVTRDLTERRRAELERERLARAEEAVSLRDEFLSIASHEIRTPLTALSLQLEALLEIPHTRTPERIQRVKQSADRLADLIESVFDTSRMAAGALELQRERFDLREAMLHIVSSMQESAERAACPLSLEASGPVVGSWDRTRIEQIATNLVANALKFAAGTPVTVRLFTEDEHAVLEVLDGGPGVPEEHAERIFGRFQRAAPRERYGGLGLGLYITREVVDAHGGNIVAANRPGGGARFSVRLPVEPR